MEKKSKCVAINRKGKQCGNYPKSDSIYCHIHESVVAPTETNNSKKDYSAYLNSALGIFASILIGYIFYSNSPSKNTQNEIYENQKEILDRITILNHPELERIFEGEYIIARYGLKSNVILHKGFVRGLYLDWDDVNFITSKQNEIYNIELTFANITYNSINGGGVDGKHVTLEYKLKVGQYAYNSTFNGIGIKIVMYLMEEDNDGLTMAIGVSK